MTRGATRRFELSAPVWEPEVFLCLLAPRLFLASPEEEAEQEGNEKCSVYKNINSVVVLVRFGDFLNV